MDEPANDQKPNSLFGFRQTKHLLKHVDSLSSIQVLAYKIGHFCNDLCLSMWFIFLTYYLAYTVELPPKIVALTLLVG